MERILILVFPKEHHVIIIEKLKCSLEFFSVDYFHCFDLLYRVGEPLSFE